MWVFNLGVLQLALVPENQVSVSNPSLKTHELGL